MEEGKDTIRYTWKVENSPATMKALSLDSDNERPKLDPKKFPQRDLDGNPICEHPLYDIHLSGSSYCCICEESLPIKGLLRFKKRNMLHARTFF